MLEDIFFIFFAVLLLAFTFLSSQARFKAAQNLSDRFLRMQTVFFLLFIIFSAYYVWIIVAHQFGLLSFSEHLYMTKMASTLIFLFASLSFYYLLKVKIEYSPKKHDFLQHAFYIVTAAALLYVLGVFLSFLWIGTEAHTRFLSVIPVANLLFVFLYLYLGFKLERAFKDPVLKQYTQFCYTFIVLTLIIFTTEALAFILPLLQENIIIVRLAILVAFTTAVLWGRFTTLKALHRIQENFGFGSVEKPSSIL